MPEDATQQQREGLFNTAMGSIIRINSLLDACVRTSAHLDVTKWFKTLEQFQKELWAKMTEQQRKHTDTRFKYIYTKFIENFTISEMRGLSHDKSIDVPRELYVELDSLEKYLRVIADKAGLLIPDKDSVKKSFGDV